MDSGAYHLFEVAEEKGMVSGKYYYRFVQPDPSPLPDTREWLLTNGLGSFASGTVCDAHTRTYHGWLIAALTPPTRRSLLLSCIDASLDLGGDRIELGTNFWASGAIAPTGYTFLKSFTINPVPTWIWGGEDWQLTRQILMPYGIPSSEEASFVNRTLIRYHYEGNHIATLKLRPLICDRDFHQQQHASLDLHFAQVVAPQRILIQANRDDWRGTAWQLCWTQGSYREDGFWYWNYRYPEETRRGLGDREDLYSPGYITVTLQPNESITLEARVAQEGMQTDLALSYTTFDREVKAEQARLQQFGAPLLAEASPQQQPLLETLLQAGDRFIVRRSSINGPTIIAGYPWFNDWGRDTLIALPGLTLTTHQFEIAKGLLRTFGSYCQNGLIPNTFPDAGEQPSYNSLDASLWWIETLGLYLETTQDWEFLREQYPTVRRIYKALLAGTDYNIRVDAIDFLLTWNAPDVALTWMDAVVQGGPMTPRRGKAIEINALWYSALCWACSWADRLSQMATAPEEVSKLTAQAQRYAQQADQVKESLAKFWNPASNYLFDLIDPDDRPDGSIRPNAVIALSLCHCGFSDAIGRSVMNLARDRLLTPYGLRSLDPFHPDYIGHYILPGNFIEGEAAPPEVRDRAYHQGTVWGWLIGPFIRGWRRFYPLEPLPWNSTALIDHLHNQACLGSVSEIFDGEPPHSPQGAIAQAWSVAELLRHWKEL